MNYEVWKKTKENDKNIASGQPIAEIGKHAVEHGNTSLLEPWV